MTKLSIYAIIMYKFNKKGWEAMLTVKKKKSYILLSVFLVIAMLFSFSLGIIAQDDGELIVNYETEESGEETTVDYETEKNAVTTEPHAEDTTLPAANNDDPQKKAEIVDFFNSNVNKVKQDSPGFRFSYEQGLLAGKQMSGFWGLLSELLGWTSSFIKNFNSGSTQQIETILGFLFIGGSETTEYKDVLRGQDCTAFVPMRGRSYVSALRASDDFTYEYNDYGYGTTTLKITFPDTIDPGPDSALSRVFDLLPIEELYSFYYDASDSTDWSRVHVKYTNAYIECSTKNGELYTYAAHYENSVIVSSSSDADANKLKFPDSMFLSETRMTNIDWSERKTGDCNNDGIINATDARLCLRASSKLITVDQSDFKYYDVDGDGKITAKDARKILRVSSGLDKF